MKLSFVIPCYNESGNVTGIHDAITDVFAGQDGSYEMLFVNDGSTDSTQKELETLHLMSKQNVKVVQFSRNFGKEAAMYAGLKEASGDYVCIIDADLQQRPETALDMLHFLETNPETDCVTAFQETRKEGKVLSFFKNRFYGFINRISEIEFVQGASDFRMFRRNMVDAILQLNEYYRFSKGIFSWVGFETHYMPYEVQERASGDSKWSFFKLLKYAVEGIVSFSTFPLKIATITGVMTACVSIIYLVIVFIQKLFFNISVPGYATIVILTLLLGGIQLFALGMIGEYLSRTYVETKKRPIYIAKKVLEPEQNKEKQV